MSGRTVHSAMFLLVVGNLLALFSDVIIKIASGDIALFQFIALRLLITLVLLLPFVGQVNLARLFEGTRVHLLRAHVGLAGVVCMVIALSALPLATANALFYLAPVLVMGFGMLLFGERFRWLNLLTVIGGLAGVLLILRPGELSLAGLSAVGLAVALAVNALLVRKLPKKQSLAHSMLLYYIFALPAALILAVVEGAPLDLSALHAAFGSALFILGYNASIVLAYRHVDAGQVTASEYSGIVWAILLGWLIFAERPDGWFLAGTALIVGPMLIQGLRSIRFSPKTIVPGRAFGGSPARAPSARCSAD